MVVSGTVSGPPPDPVPPRTEARMIPQVSVPGDPDLLVTGVLVLVDNRAEPPLFRAGPGEKRTP